MHRIFAIVLALFTASVGLTACQYSQSSGNLAGTRVTWMDYLDGGDIRRACEAEGGPQRYRMVLMADAYGVGVGNQARGFDLRVQPDGTGVLDVVVDRGITFTGPTDIRQVGATPRAQTGLGRAAVDRIVDALGASNAFQPPPVGLRLNTQEHFWIVSGCRRGDYFLTAFAYPQPGWSTLRFPSVLAELDPLTAAVAWPQPPRPQTGRPACPVGRDADGPAVCYTVHIGANGLVR